MAQTGLSTARISLSPDTLGGIRISLSQTSQGVVARVVADHPEATQALQQNVADLRRSLEASGVNVARLEVSSSGDQSLGGFQGSQNGASSSGTGSGSQQGSGGTAENADGENPETTSTELTLELQSGSLVDVLA